MNPCKQCSYIGETQGRLKAHATKYHPITEEEVSKWVEDFSKGQTLIEIAKNHKRVPSTIGNYLRKNGYTRSKYQSIISVSANNNNTIICRVCTDPIYFSSSVVLAGHFQRLHPITPRLKLAWLEEYESGLSIQQISKNCGYGVHSISQELLKLGARKKGQHPKKHVMKSHRSPNLPPTTIPNPSSEETAPQNQTQTEEDKALRKEVEELIIFNQKLLTAFLERRDEFVVELAHKDATIEKQKDRTQVLEKELEAMKVNMELIMETNQKLAAKENEKTFNGKDWKKQLEPGFQSLGTPITSNSGKTNT